MNFNPQALLQMAMQMNPNLQNNAQAQEIIKAIMNDDRQRGEELARNYCQSMGVTPEQGTQQAQQFFQQMMGGQKRM